MSIIKNMKIKICGQNNPRVIEHCLNLPIEYQGLIFYEKSPRNVNIDTLKLIQQYYSDYSSKFVGVFVNPTLQEIEEKLNVFDFHTIQLHGSENQKFINEVKSTFQKKIFKSLSPEKLIENDLSNVDYYLIEGKPEKMINLEETIKHGIGHNFQILKIPFYPFGRVE